MTITPNAVSRCSPKIVPGAPLSVMITGAPRLAWPGDWIRASDRTRWAPFENAPTAVTSLETRICPFAAAPALVAAQLVQ